MTKNIMLLPSCLEIRDQLGEGMTLAQLRKMFPMHTKKTLESELKTGLETGYILLERSIFKSAKAVQNAPTSKGDEPVHNLFDTVQNTPIHTITDVNGETFKSTLDADMWHWMESLPNAPTKEAVQNTPINVKAVQNTPIKEAVQNTPTTDIIKYSIAAILTRLDMQTKAISDQTGVNAAEIRAIKRQGSAISFDRALSIAIKLGQTTAFLSEIIKESAKVHQSITGEKMKPIKSIQKEIF